MSNKQPVMIRLNETVSVITLEGILEGKVVGATVNTVTVEINNQRHMLDRAQAYRTRYQRLVIDRSK